MSSQKKTQMSRKKSQKKTPSGAARKIQSIVRKTQAKSRLIHLRKRIGMKNTTILQILYEQMKIGAKYHIYTREEKNLIVLKKTSPESVEYYNEDDPKCFTKQKGRYIPIWKNFYLGRQNIIHPKNMIVYISGPASKTIYGNFRDVPNKD